VTSPRIEPERDVALAPRTTFEVGGAARFYFEAESAEEVKAALAWATERGLGVEVLGGGSNVIVADRGIDALVLRVRDRSRRVEREGDEVIVEAGAGHGWDALVGWSVAEDHAGIECMSGIPGDVGAAPMQNVGAYGQEVAETIERVSAIERASGAEALFDRAACAFSYRDSFFKRAGRGRYVVTAVRFRLRPRGPATLRYPELTQTLGGGVDVPLKRVREAVIALRRSKSMVIDAEDDNRRSAGSFFLNPIVGEEEAERVASLAGQEMPRFAVEAGRVKLSAAWLIERAGLIKGTVRGRVGISTRHSLAIVNRGGASAAELVDFAAEVRARVHDRFGVALAPEPRLLGFSTEEIAALV
jgi:UDP-N-acetylmuramate dehydrogenase